MTHAEELKAAKDLWVDAQKARKRLALKNDRLREVLKEIAAFEVWACDKKEEGDAEFYVCNRMKKIAQQALTPL